jgi:hypothetical protein
MLSRRITALHTIDPGPEDPAATRARLKDAFPAGAARRMTQLGMLVGATLEALGPRPDDAIVYASQFGEGRALEAFLDSFPGASPTLFQTSIHPSGVQQGLIARQRTTPEIFPIAGSPAQVAQALLATMLAPAPRTLFCGGEERGTWLTEHRAASDRTFAFAMALSQDSAEGTLGRVALEPDDGTGALALAAWFDLLHARRPFNGIVAPGWRLRLEWS